MSPRDPKIPAGTWNPDAGGGGNQVDVRWDSDFPMLFRWQAADGESEMLVWGAVDDPDFAYDELERAEGDSDDFAFVAHVRRETQNGVPLVCMRYEDLGLKDHARYRYRVRHVFKNGAKGAWQPACEGLTREGPAGGN